MKKKKTKNKKYYAVWGENGLGVFNDWTKAQKNLNYLEKSNCKGFKTHKEAVKEALSNYNDLSGDEFEGPLPLNIGCDTDMIELIREQFDSKDKIVASYEDREWRFNKA